MEYPYIQKSQQQMFWTPYLYNVTILSNRKEKLNKALPIQKSMKIIKKPKNLLTIPIKNNNN